MTDPALIAIAVATAAICGGWCRLRLRGAQVPATAAIAACAVVVVVTVMMLAWFGRPGSGLQANLKAAILMMVLIYPLPFFAAFLLDLFVLPHVQRSAVGMCLMALAVFSLAMWPWAVLSGGLS